jgi:hypothetical protein
MKRWEFTILGGEAFALPLNRAAQQPGKLSIVGLLGARADEVIT